MIHDIGDITLDFSRIDWVGSILETENDSRYVVHFGQGNQLEIFHNRKILPSDINLICMPREKFISLWKQSKKPGCKMGCKKKEKLRGEDCFPSYPLPKSTTDINVKQIDIRGDDTPF